ncbi:hypothetical protein [Pseudoxanthomonas sp.]|uniref:hypothetical protein n=1 Tax=Pseudoxanthomonas sp. TaxID=1871049 RepID=UPI00261E4000|nr:hypothetical protein [Pseudoxanthomonas sp.]WDS36674.1 MAG: hypothetical protein O8I58_01775 [Pseudoxanthomonas sp.]
MKAVIALVIALALLAIGIPLSRAISDGEQHTITRTVEPLTPAQERDALASRKADATNKHAPASATGAAPATTAR